MNYYPYSIPVLMYARLLQNQQALAAYTGSICAFKEIMWRSAHWAMKKDIPPYEG